jgi:hypothetical protein
MLNNGQTKLERDRATTVILELLEAYWPHVRCSNQAESFAAAYEIMWHQTCGQLDFFSAFLAQEDVYLWPRPLASIANYEIK